MRCPRCWHRLKVIDRRRLETLIEHGFAPNDEPSLKNAWGCVNERCLFYRPEIVWDDFGYGYLIANEAMFSWAWHYHVWRRHWNRWVLYPWIRLKHRGSY